MVVQPFKHQVPENLPYGILKEFAYELVEPVTTFFNAFLASGIVPAICKGTDMTTIPKTQFPTSEGEFRPITRPVCLRLKRTLGSRE